MSYDTKLKEDASLDVCVQKFEQLLNQVEEKRELLVSEVQIYLINPMDVFVSSDLKEVRVCMLFDIV